MATTTLKVKPLADEFNQGTATDAEVARIHPDSVGSELAPSHYTDPAVDGGFRIKDVKVPWIKVAQKMGKMGETFPVGSLILSDEVPLITYGKPRDAESPHLNGVQVLHVMTYFKEQVKYDPNRQTQPATFRTAEDVVKAGYTTEWGPEKDAQEGYCGPGCKAILLVPAPASITDEETLDNHFIYRHNGVNYAMGAIIIERTNWTATGTVLATVHKNPIIRAKGGIGTIKWDMFTSLRDKGNVSYLFRLKQSGKCTPEELAYGQSLVASA